MVHSIPTWLDWAEIECAVYVPLPKWSINQFKPVQQSRQQALRAYCPNIYTVPGIRNPGKNRLKLKLSASKRLRVPSIDWTQT